MSFIQPLTGGPGSTENSDAASDGIFEYIEYNIWIENYHFILYKMKYITLPLCKVIENKIILDLNVFVFPSSPLVLPEHDSRFQPEKQKQATNLKASPQ